LQLPSSRPVPLGMKGNSAYEVSSARVTPLCAVDEDRQRRR
jgi:hypothetical protein